ncbi:MAG: hypothetical protein KAT48_13725 [Bacteroidales bacterium]|nr:hypothetical protein [Bacteroidales bacterium]
MKTINRYIVLIIGLVCLLYSARVNWSEDQWPGIIQSDGKGYYAYLPAFITQLENLPCRMFIHLHLFQFSYTT